MGGTCIQVERHRNMKGTHVAATLGCMVNNGHVTTRQANPSSAFQIIE